MQAEELDRVYTSLAEALGRAGEARANLLLATLALELMSREADVGATLRAIERAERASRV